VKFQQRSSVYTNLRQYCHLAKSDAVVEVCEWSNGEGWDIAFDNKIISLTYGELEAINVLTKIKYPKE
jgi:hypothetical protein